MNNNKLSILFLLQKVKLNKQGKCPIKCRITFHQDRKEFSTGLFVNPKQWDSRLQKTKPPNEENSFINTQLGLIKNEINQAFLFLQVNEENFDVGDIYLQYKGDVSIRTKTILELFKEHTDKKLIEGVIETTYDPNETAVNYASAGIGETFGDQGVKDVFVNFPIGNITYSATPPPGKITITGSDGNGGTGSTTEYPGGKDYTFTDSNGVIWTVDENGTVTKSGTVAQGGASTSTNS